MEFQDLLMEGSGEDSPLLLDSASLFPSSSMVIVNIMSTSTDESTTEFLMPFSSDLSSLSPPPTPSSSSSSFSSSSQSTLSSRSVSLTVPALSQTSSQTVFPSPSSTPTASLPQTTPPQSSDQESTSSVMQSSSSPLAIITTPPSRTFSSLTPSVSPAQTASSTRPSSTPIATGRVPVATVMPLNATAILVSWTLVTDSSGYVIYLWEGTSGRRKRQAGEETTIRIFGGHVTSHVISGLKPFTSYSVSMASVDMNGVVGPRSELTVPLSTEEAAPSLPRNITWEYLGEDGISITWLPPEFPNGVITNYTVVLLFDDGSQTQYTVSGTQFMLNVSRPGVEFSVVVSAVNSAGKSLFQNGTMIVPPETSNDYQSLSSEVIAVIVIFSVLLMLMVITAVVTVLILSWRKWYHKYHGRADINVDEIEYKSSDLTNFENSGDDTDDGQLTAKRWMRANANYSVPSLLLTPISELVDSYRTAEDVVEAKTIFRPRTSSVLGTIGESSTPTKEGPPSANSSSERSCEAPSTLSSVCSKTQQEVNRVVLVQHTTTGEPVSNRDSRLENDDQALFDMMENVYLANPFESDSLKTLEIQDPSVMDIKEQVGLGHCTKVMRAYITSSCSSRLQRGSEVAVKILDDDDDDADVRNKDSFVGAAYIMTQFSHQNLLPLLGIRTASLPLMAVFSFVSLGDLKHYLTRVRRKTRLESQPCNFGLSDQLFMSFQIASGMEYLASKFFIHRALQAKCVLLDEDHNIKITGFRTSHALAKPGGYLDLKTAGRLPVKWLSIETLTKGKFSSNTDIWSFGVVLWEIFAFGLTPFRGVQNEDILGHLKEGKRLNKPSECREDIYSLMLHCWVESARERPSFSTLHTHLLACYNAHQREEKAKTRGESQSTTRPEPDTTTNQDNVIIPATVSIPQSDSDTVNGGGDVENGLSPRDSESLPSADNNSRINLHTDNHPLPPPPDQDGVRMMSAKNCDLVLTATNGYNMELSPTDHVSNGEHSVTNELYTKL